MNTMYSDREEIRWQFQVMNDIVNNFIRQSENDRSNILDNLYRYSAERKEVRNTVLGMIAFGIGLAISLISINVIDEYYAWLIIPAIIGAGAIYLIINYRIYSYTVKVNKLNSRCYLSIADLAEIKGYIAVMSVREEITKGITQKLFQYLHLIYQAYAYDMVHYSYEMIKTPIPNQELFRSSYTEVKEKLDMLKKVGHPSYNDKFDLFITEFEKNERNSKN